MKQSDLLDALNRRVPFRVARRLLVDSDFPTGHGWDAVMEKLKDKDVAAKANMARLRALYTQALATSEKRLSVYEVDRISLNSIDKSFAKLLKTNTSDPIVQAFPLPIAQALVAAGSVNDPVVAGMVNWPWGRLYLLSYVKESRERIAISPSQIKGVIGAPLTEAYGIRIQRNQVFDAVIVSDNDDRLFLLTDILDNRSLEYTRDSVSRVMQFVKQQSGVSMKATRLNLFDAIAPFYCDKDVDILTLDHLTPDGRAVREKVKGDQVCVRDGKFHQGGMAASGNTDAFGIQVAWNLPSRSNSVAYVDLTLEGPASLAHDLNPSIEFGTISRAGTTAEMSVVLTSISNKI